MRVTPQAGAALRAATFSKNARFWGLIAPRFQRTVKALFGLLVGFAVLVGMIASPATTAQAVITGTINSLTAGTAFDGEQVPNAFDDGRNNGLVAAGDTVGLNMTMRSTDLQGGEVMYQLPRGWEWEDSAITVIEGEAAASSDYRVENVRVDNAVADKRGAPDRRMLTFEYYSTAAPGTTVTASFTSLRAHVTNTAALGEQKPRFTVRFDSAVWGTSGADPVPITVVGEQPGSPRIQIDWINGKSKIWGGQELHDFGDGLGPVPAKFADARVSIFAPEGWEDGVLGMSAPPVQQPLTLYTDDARGTEHYHSHSPFYVNGNFSYPADDDPNFQDLHPPYLGPPARMGTRTVMSTLTAQSQPQAADELEQVSPSEGCPLVSSEPTPENRRGRQPCYYPGILQSSDPQSTVQVEIVSRTAISAKGGNALVPNEVLKFTLDDFDSIYNSWFDFRYYARLSEFTKNPFDDDVLNSDGVPARFFSQHHWLPAGWDVTAGNPIRPNNPFDPVWRDEDGQLIPITDRSSGHTDGWVVFVPPPPSTVTEGSLSKGLFALSDQSAAAGGLASDPARPSVGTQLGVAGRDNYVAKGDLVAARFAWKLPYYVGTMSAGAYHPIVYDFWDPTQQQIVPGASLYTGESQGTTPVAASELTVQYTNGSDSANPEANTWFDSVADAGGVEQVSGIRVASAVDYWGFGKAVGTEYIVALPMRIVGDVGDLAIDRGAAKDNGSEDRHGPDFYIHAEAEMKIGHYADLSISIDASKPSIAAGDSVDYSIKPNLQLAPGMVLPTVPRPLVEVELPAGLTAVAPASEPGWILTQSGDLATGLKLSYEYDGDWDTSLPLPEFTYQVTSSIATPVGELETRASVSVLDGPVAAQELLTRSTVHKLPVTAYTGVGIVKQVLGDSTVTPNGAVTWETTLINGTDSALPNAYSLQDVLPWDGDPRGTSISAGGSYVVTKVEVDRVGPSGSFPSVRAAEISSAPPATLYNVAPGSNLGWSNVTATTDFTGVTAVRYGLSGFGYVPAHSSVKVRITIQLDKMQPGDMLVNTAEYWNNSFTMLESNESTVTVAEEPPSSISGTVWLEGDPDHTGIAGADVTLIDDATGATVDTAVSDADGAYTFTGLDPGSYRVQIDRESLGAGDNQKITNTVRFDPAADEDDSGVILLASGTDIASVDFEYRFETFGLLDLPLTGGLSSDAFMIGGAAILLVSLCGASYVLRRRRRAATV